ncbi:MAG: hypothetical protein DRP09_12400 [Candidatus Thorarchaeota archaeon]|nr:MAG: hypothetical protein DRP09_12400 [Candidatus Thorarchaeota archaeon]
MRGPNNSERPALSELERTEVTQTLEGEKTLDRKKPRYFQVDALKAVAIALVVLDHSVTWDIKHAIYAPFWERLSIPLFLIIMGFNLGLSFRRREEQGHKGVFSTEYLNSRVTRYMFPFLILYLTSTVAGLLFQQLEFNEYVFLCYLPFWGPGNWFIPLLFTSIVGPTPSVQGIHQMAGQNTGRLFSQRVGPPAHNVLLLSIPHRLGCRGIHCHCNQGQRSVLPPSHWAWTLVLQRT